MGGESEGGWVGSQPSLQQHGQMYSMAGQEETHKEKRWGGWLATMEGSGEGGWLAAPVGPTSKGGISPFPKLAVFRKVVIGGKMPTLDSQSAQQSTAALRQANTAGLPRSSNDASHRTKGIHCYQLPTANCLQARMMPPCPQDGGNGGVGVLLKPHDISGVYYVAWAHNRTAANYRIGCNGAFDLVVRGQLGLTRVFMAIVRTCTAVVALPDCWLVGSAVPRDSSHTHCSAAAISSVGAACSESCSRCAHCGNHSLTHLQFAPEGASTAAPTAAAPSEKVTSGVARAGLRVVRGPDWKWGDQVGGF